MRSQLPAPVQAVIKKTYVGMGEDLWRTSAWLKDESKGRN